MIFATNANVSVLWYLDVLGAIDTNSWVNFRKDVSVSRVLLDKYREW